VLDISAGSFVGVRLRQVKVMPIGHEDAYRVGVRFYRPHPYLKNGYSIQ
jgi:hypothetical protein